MTERPICAMASPSIPRRLRCSRPGQHLDPCTAPDLDCRGCFPNQAGPDSPVCQPCENRGHTALAELPDLHIDLAERPRIQTSRAEASEDMDDAAGAPIEGGRIDARHAIRHALNRAAAVLERTQGIHTPSQSAHVRHADLSARARDLAELLSTPGPDGTPPDLAAAAAARTEAGRHAALAEAARHDRATGRDVVRALAVHVDRHLATLIKQPTGVELLADLIAAHRTARSKANPSRDDRQRIVCSCGAWVTLDAEETMTCRTCGAWGVLSWWVEQVAPAVTDEPMTAQGILDWLLVRHGIGLGYDGRPVVTHDDVRQWAVRHPDKVVRRGKNTRGEQTYEPSAGVVALAEKKAARRIPRPRPESE